MNRQIKFRAWDTETNEMIENFARLSANGRMYTIHTPEPEPTYEVMQFTGLLDKNGKEIYEGDLIKHSGYIYKIIFNNCGFTAINTDSKTAVPAECEFLNNIELEVVGNIYENSNLVDQKQ